MDPETGGTKSFAIASPERADGVKPQKRSRKRKCLICCGITTGISVLLIVILIILAFTVFKPRDPELTIDSVTLEDLKLNLDEIFTNFDASVDVKLDTKVTVKNPNYAGFKYRNTTAFIFYHGKEIGDSSIPAGEIKARSSAKLDVPIEVQITGALFNKNLTEDIASGILPIGTRVEIRGTASFLGIIKLKNAVANSNCELEIFISNATLKDSDCQNKFSI